MPADSALLDPIKDGQSSDDVSAVAVDVIRRRQTSPKFADDQAVRAPLFAAVRHMTRWQTEAAHLRALIDSKKVGRSANLDDRIHSLRFEVVEARQNVEAIVGELPDRLKNHSRVTDIAGAMQRLEALVAALSTSLAGSAMRDTLRSHRAGTM